MNLIEIAVRKKLRFESAKGHLTIEELFDVPLRGNAGFNLDAIAQAAHKQVEKVGTVSFVDTDKENKEQVRAALTLEVVKYVIDSAKADEEAKKVRAANKIEADKLRDILANKQNEKLLGLSEAEIRKRIDALVEG